MSLFDSFAPMQRPNDIAHRRRLPSKATKLAQLYAAGGVRCSALLGCLPEKGGIYILDTPSPKVLALALPTASYLLGNKVLGKQKVRRKYADASSI